MPFAHQLIMNSGTNHNFVLLKQKNFKQLTSMNTKHISANKKELYKSYILKALLYFHNLAALTMYIFVRLLFHDYNIPLKEDFSNLLRTLLIASSLATGMYLMYVVVIAAQQLWKERRIPAFSFSPAQIALVIVLFLITVSGCGVRFH